MKKAKTPEEFCALANEWLLMVPYERYSMYKVYDSKEHKWNMFYELPVNTVNLNFHDRIEHDKIEKSNKKDFREFMKEKQNPVK